VETKASFPESFAACLGLEIRRFRDSVIPKLGELLETRLCCFVAFLAGRTRRCALGSAEHGRLFVKRGGSSHIC
jgi:hypothetical protein